jgi:hypothetical protein
MPNGRTPDRELRLAALARAQHGVVSAEQLLALGFSRGAIQHRVRTLRWAPVHRGVYAVGPAPLSADGRAMAAVLACGAGAVLSHRSAAILLGLLGGGQARWEVTTPLAGGGRRGPSAVHLRRTRRLDRRDVTSVRGIPVTTVPRTLIDLADSAPRLVPKAVHEAEVRRLLDVAAVRAALQRTPGRRGAAVLLSALGPDGAEPDHGAFVAAYLRLCADYGLPAPEVGTYLDVNGTLHEIDVLYRAQRVIVELDGEAVHRTRRRFHADRRRDAGLAAHGFLTVRYTWDSVTGEPRQVAREVLSILARRAAA